MVTPPPAPSATTAALARVWPALKFNVETVGEAPPCGKILMKPGPWVLVTVMFRETAWAVAAMPHRPMRVKLRGEPAAREGGPYWPVNPLPRVSTTRQGGTAISGRGVTAVAS